MLAYARRLRRCLPRGSTAVDRARARHEQLSPGGAERLQGRPHVGARDDARSQRRLASRTALAAHVTAGRRRRRRAGVGPRASGGRATSSAATATSAHGHALYNYGSLDGGVGSDLERAAGVLRRRRACGTRGASPRSTTTRWRASGPRSHRSRSSRYHRAVQLRRRHDAGNRDAATAGSRPMLAPGARASAGAQGLGHAALPAPSTNSRLARAALVGAQPGSCVLVRALDHRTRSARGHSETSSCRIEDPRARARRRSSRCRRRPPPRARRAASARSRAARRARRAR